MLRIVEARPLKTTSTVHAGRECRAPRHSSSKRAPHASRSRRSSAARIMNQARVRSGMMLAAVPPSRIDAVDAGVGPELLAPQADRVEQQDHRVERVEALPGVRRRVGLAAGEGDLDVLAGQQPAGRRGSRSQGWNRRAASSPSNRPSSIMMRLARAALLGRACRGRRSRRAARGRSRPGRSPPRRPRRPSCCGRSRGRARAGRRTRPGSRSAAVAAGSARPPAAVPGPPSPACRPGARPRSRGRAARSATQAAAWSSSKAGSGVGVDPVATGRGSRPGSPRPHAASRRLTSANGAGRDGLGIELGHDGLLREAGSGSAFDRQGRLGHDDHRQDEQGDRQAEALPRAGAATNRAIDEARPRRRAGRPGASRRDRRSGGDGRTSPARRAATVVRPNGEPDRGPPRAAWRSGRPSDPGS